MSKNKDGIPYDLGAFVRDGGGLITPVEVIAIVLSAIWLIGVAAFFKFAPQDSNAQPLEPAIYVMQFLAIILPVAMIWVVAVAARSSRTIRSESARLQSAIDAMRQAYVSQAQSGAKQKDTSLEKKLDEIFAAQKQTETAIATFSLLRQTAQSADKPAITAEGGLDGGDQTSLAFGTTAEDIALPISVADFIRAMDFPENLDDRAGFNVLRRALKDRQVSGLIRAAQDVLTLLSQEGIYMDDLKSEPASPNIWRKFAAGERGEGIHLIGGVRDKSSLTLATGRMRQDPIFRDTVHHFLRQFDKTFTEFEHGATDQDIIRMANTRTARAFMLLGRVMGAFD